MGTQIREGEEKIFVGRVEVGGGGRKLPCATLSPPE